MRESLGSLGSLDPETVQLTPSGGGGAASGASAPADRLALFALSAGHLVTDINQGGMLFLAVFLKPTFHLSYASVFLVATTAQVMGSLMQPVFGWMTDHMRQRWLLPAGCFASGAGMALIAVGPSYAVLVLLVCLSGLGVAAFHPEAARGANLAAGGRRSTGMATYSVGGNLGYALGPLVIAGLWRAGGLHALWFLAVPTTAAAIVLFAMRGRFNPDRDTAEGRPLPMRAILIHPPLLRLLAMVTLRSWLQGGFAAFLPFFLIAARGVPRADTANYIFAFLAAGAVGTALGGPAADRWGRRRMVSWGMATLAPLALLALVLPAWALPWELGIFGGILVSSFAVTTVMAQAMLPRNTGMASALLVGFAIGMGGLAVWLLALLADHAGVTTVLVLSALTPLPALLLANSLPDDRRGDVGEAGG